MPFPAGVITRTVHLPQIVDSSGTPVTGVLTIVPFVPLKWAATSQIVLSGPSHVSIIDGTAEVVLPIVQSGFVLANSRRVDVWTYRAVLSLSADIEGVNDYVFVLPAGSEPYELDFATPPVVPEAVTTLTEYVTFGLPPGGLPGQIPAKVTDLDFDVVWVDNLGGSGGGGSSGGISLYGSGDYGLGLYGIAPGSGGGGGGAWGQILGNINDQADLDAALDGKAPLSHTHPASQLTATGTPSSTTFLRGDNVWAQPSGADLVGIQVFEHGSNAAAIRPSTNDIVIWVGNVQPNNWIDGDQWINATPG